MTDESFKVIIVALASFWTFILIVFLVMMFVLYRRMSRIRASILQAIAAAKEAVKPIMQIAAILEAVRNGLDLVDKVLEFMKGGKQNGRTTAD